MCNFLSVLVMRDGSVRHHPMLDSHSDLIAYFNIPDETNYIHRFAKAELTPADWMDASTWTWRIDEGSRPDWLDDVEGAAEKKARSIAARMILREDRAILADGAWIVPAGVTVQRVIGGRVVRVRGTVHAVSSGGVVRAVESGGTVEAVVSGGTVQRVESGGVVQAVVSGGVVQRVVSGGTVNGERKQ